MVSIVTPTHRLTPLFDLTLKSVFLQDDRDWEWVLVDSSPAGYVEEYVNRFIDNNSEFEFCRNKVIFVEADSFKDCPGSMKMLGFRHVTCGPDDFVFFLDHDDFLAPHLIKNVHDAVKRFPDTEYVGGDISVLMYNTETCDMFSTSFYNPVYGKCVKGYSKINIGGEEWSFNSDCIQLYRGIGSSTSMVHPSIFRKSVIDKARVAYICETQQYDDALVFCEKYFLKEAYIMDLTYIHMKYLGGELSGSSDYNRIMSDITIPIGQLVEDMIEHFVQHKFEKTRSLYIPEIKNVNI